MQARIFAHLPGIRAIGLGRGLIVVVAVVLQLLVGLGIPLLLDKSSKLLETIRTGFLVRMVLPPIVVAKTVRRSTWSIAQGRNATC